MNIYKLISLVTVGAARYIILTVPNAMNVEQRPTALRRNLCVNEKFLNLPKTTNKQTCCCMYSNVE